MYSVIRCEVPAIAPFRLRARCVQTVNACDSDDIINVTQHSKPSLVAYYVNLLCGLQQCKNETVFVCEHDVLYPPSWFDESLIRSAISYAHAGLYLSAKGYSPRNGTPLSTLAGDRDTIAEAVMGKIRAVVERGKAKHSEPGIGDEFCGVVTLRTNPQPYIDVRHGANHTGTRPAERYALFDATCTWTNAIAMLEELGMEYDNEL